MGGPLVDCSAEGVSSSSCLSRSTCEKAGFEHSSCALPEDEKFEAGIACVKDDLVVKEISSALAEVMHVYDDNDDEGTSEDSDENEDSLSLESDSADDLVDIGTELVTSSAFSAGNASESSTGKSEDGNSSTNGTQPLVSAMKGSRAKRGIVTKLSVSWAPDVYDPPVTSDSHTVKPHQRSSRKSHYKYKPPKGGSSSSSRTSSGSKKDKKHSHHSSSSSSKRDKKPSYRSSNAGSSRTDASDPQHRKAYGSSITSRTDTSVPEYHKLSPWQPPASAAVEEAMPPVPVLKAMEQIKRSSSCCKEPPLSMKAMEQIKRSSSCCKEPPISMLSRQFVAAKYKGMFSFLSQNQLAS
ncbi:hypothetical protein ACQJBY_023802 [Aegilops geniculata]